MASSSSPLLLLPPPASPPPCRSSNLQLQRISVQFTVPIRRTSRGLKKDLSIRKATPEAAGGLFPFNFPTIPDFSDNPWIAGVAGLVVAVPLLTQWLLTLTKEVDIAAQTVEKIAETVEKVAEEVEHAAENMAESLPEGGLKKMVSFVEEIAEETAKDAEKVEQLMDKVEEMDEKLEAFLKKTSDDTEKA